MNRTQLPRLLAAALLATTVLAAPADARHRHHAADAAQNGSDADGTQATASDGFDYYLLSLSVSPSFCRLSPRNGALDECQALTEAGFERTPLTLHGLWPNRARVSVNQQPHDCGTAPLGELPGPLQADLGRWMPGGAHLEGHEWSKHGTCSGLSPAAYFGEEVQLAQMMDQAIGAKLRDAHAFGTSVKVADLIASVSADNPALGAAIVVNCQTPRGGGDTLIGEIRVTLSRDFQPIPAASVGLGQNSGCRNGEGVIPRVGG